MDISRLESFNFLKSNLRIALQKELGVVDDSYLNRLTFAWMDDRHNSSHRYDELERYLTPNSVILDCAAGCGTFVFCGLLNRYSVFGIEPEDWKREFCKKKVNDFGYDESWINRIKPGYAEELPFDDNSFCVVSSHQTIEHVDDVTRAVREFFRVVRPGGVIQISCPSYAGTYEPHYQLPWLPLFPKFFANFYLRMLGRDTQLLSELNYVTERSLLGLLELEASRCNVSISIRNVQEEKLKVNLRKLRLSPNPLILTFFKYFNYLRNLFVKDTQINIIVEC